MDEHIHVEEGREERPHRRLPDIPLGRKDHVSMLVPPGLHAYDQSSIGGQMNRTGLMPSKWLMISNLNQRHPLQQVQHLNPKTVHAWRPQNQTKKWCKM